MASKRKCQSVTFRMARAALAFNSALMIRHRPLIIDPVLVYSTYLGGSGFDQGYAIAVDSLGNAYVTGQTAAIDFPTTPGPFKPTMEAAMRLSPSSILPAARLSIRPISTAPVAMVSPSTLPAMLT